MMGPERLGYLIDRHAAALELYARQWCASPEDVVQEAFLKLSRTEVEPVHVAGWLYRVVRNGSISAGRSESRRRRHEAVAAVRADWFTDDAGSAIDAAVLTQALRKLPLEERETIVAHLWGGLPFTEIALLVGTSAATAHRRYAAGLEQLRLELELPCPPKPPS
jgi:RNA polymerase sigma factor (sigma-70 family)